MRIVIALIVANLFWQEYATADELVRAVCANDICELVLAEPSERVAHVQRGETFVVNYIFDDSIQVRTGNGSTGVFRNKKELVIEGDFALDDSDSVARIADYTRVLQEMTTEFLSLPKKRNLGFKVTTAPWEDFSPSDKGVILKKETVAIDECAGDPIIKKYYRHGFASYGGGVDYNTYLIRDFSRLNNGIAPGMSQTAVIAALGVPMRRSQNMLTYAQVANREIAGLTGDKYDELIRIYFVDNRLVAIWLYSHVLC